MLFAQCGENSPAFPVPQTRNGVVLWPAGWRPGEPGQQLPASRDSTGYTTNDIPGAGSGNELFQALDVVGDRLYVSYNVGLQVWDIGAGNEEKPLRRAFRDGWQQHFFSFPSDFNELDTFIQGIAAVEPANGKPLIALAASAPVGLSLWRYDPDKPLGQRLGQLYQDLFSFTDTRQVAIVEHAGSTYAFAGSLGGTLVYDVARAVALAPCEDDVQSPGRSCPGVFRGHLGEMTKGGYLDVHQKAGKLYVAASDGSSQPAFGLRLEIWELADPASPASAVRRFSGAGFSSNVRSPVFFEHGATTYLAVIDDLTHLEIYDVGHCLDADGCASLGAPRWSTSVLPGDFQFLSFSRSGQTPFLYYGLDVPFFGGRAREKLLDLSTLGGSNQVVEVTASGGTYPDVCSGEPVGYWADYYPGNEHGLRNFAPREGEFRGNYFYRAARGVLDVHVRTPAAAPTTITTTVSQPGPWWMGDAVGFTASVTPPGACNGGSWTWFSDDSMPAGIAPSGTTASITFDFCGQSSCPARAPRVWATNSACPQATVVEAEVALGDPRPALGPLAVSPPGSVHPLGTELTFSASATGREPLTYTWRVFEQGSGLLVTEASGAGLDSFTGWDTCLDLGPPPLPIFGDGFESGGLSAWSGVAGAPVWHPTPAPGGDTAAVASAAFVVEVTAVNGDGSASASMPITLVQPALPGCLVEKPSE